MSEENFLDLLDNYLDLETIEQKKREDKEETVSNKKHIQTESVFTEEDSISIARYVNDYLGISGDCSKLYHSGLKEIGCSYVMGIDNNFANKNPELVHQGYLLLVIDSRNHRGTYVNPYYLKKMITKNDIEKELKTFSKKKQIELTKLSEYYKKYLEVKAEYDNNNKFYNLLKETHKVKQLKKIMKKEDVRND